MAAGVVGSGSTNSSRAYAAIAARSERLVIDRDATTAQRDPRHHAKRASVEPVVDER